MPALSKSSQAPAYRREPAQKRELLLAAAQKLFAKYGFDNTSTAQIAQQAGVSEGILFHHFGSKKGLLLKLAEDFGHRAASATMPEGTASILTEESIVRSAFAFAEANPDLYEILMKGGAEIAELEITVNSDIIINRIETNLKRAMDNQQIRRGNPRIMAQLQFALVDGAYKAWRRHSNPDDKEEYILEAIRCMKAMMAPT